MLFFDKILLLWPFQINYDYQYSH